MKMLQKIKQQLFNMLIAGDISFAVFRTIIIVCLMPIFLLCLCFVAYYIGESESQNNDAFEINRQLSEAQLHKLFSAYESETRILTKQLSDPTQSQDVMNDAYINSTLVNILNSYPELEGVMFRAKNTQFFVESRESFNKDHFTTSFGATDPTRRRLSIRELRLENFLGESKSLITLYRNVYNPNLLTKPQPSEAYLGTIFLFLRTDAIDQIIHTSNTGESLDYYLLYRDRVIYTSEKKQKFLSFSQNEIIASYPKELQRTVELSGSPSIYMKNFQVITARNQSRQLMNKTSYWVFLTLSIIFAMGIPLTIYYVINRTLIRPLELLVVEITQVQGNNRTIDTSLFPDNELGVLSRKINQMLTDLFHYNERLTNAEVKRKDAELKALKSQIQPHYLYNTLEVIRMSAIINNDDRVAKMIEHLSNQLEYILRETDMELVPLQIEINNVVDYLELINVRFEGNIRYHIEIEPNLKKLMVPRLTLQPLVENAIKHGLSQQGNQGNITLTAYEDIDDYVIEILDDGRGLSKQDLLSLKKRMGQPSNHLGISIVHLRLQDHFGPNSGLDITSKKGFWTLVRILLPKESLL